MAKATKKLICGIGVNDADYSVSVYELVNGKQKQIWVCPFYSTWKNMIRRCYSEKYKSKRSTYVSCSTVEEWHYFMTFRAWMVQQDWEGKQLDKDLLIPGNKFYGPDTCLFISSSINSFLTECSKSRGQHPIGVHVDKKSGKFRAQCQDFKENKQKALGSFNTPNEAHQAWLAYKLVQASMLAAQQSDPRVAAALIDRYENYHIYFPQAR